MKIVERIKKVLIRIGALLLTIPTKVFAVNLDRGLEPQPLYGVKPVRNIDRGLEVQPEYGVEPVRNMDKDIWDICRIFIIPIALLIGIIIYFKKSKSSKKRKVATVLITICIVAILYFVINYMINNVI